MAVTALQRDAMISRVCRRQMVEYQRCPKVAAVAVVAFALSGEMPDGLAGGSGAVVAARASARSHVRMIEARRQPARCRMADIALSGGLQVPGVLAGCGSPIVTARADADHMCVVHLRCWRERRDVVAVLAYVVGRNMAHGLADGVDVIVATDAVSGNVVVIEIGRQPGGRRMTVLAGIAAGYVPRRFAGNDCVVVAARTGTCHLQMIDCDDRSERDDRVTILADVGRRYVIDGLSDRIDGVVTVEAVAGDVVVVEIGGRERDCRVAILAIVAARYVARRFSRGNESVVTAAAGSEHLCVIDLCDRSKRDDRVAVLANARRVDVCRRLADGFDAVVTTHAVAGDVVVVEICRRETDSRVAVFTGVAAEYVIWPFAYGHCVVVAAHAGTEHLKVIYLRHGRERDDVMAIFADIRRQRVI